MKWISTYPAANGRRAESFSEAAFGGGNRACGARIEFGCHTQGTAKSLEYGLALMVRVLAAEVVNMQSDQRVIDEALEKLMGQVDIEAADHRPLEGHMKFQPRTPGKIDD